MSTLLLIAFLSTQSYLLFADALKVYRHIVNEEKVFTNLFKNIQHELATFPLCLIVTDSNDDNDSIEYHKELNIKSSDYYRELRDRNISALTLKLGVSISQLLNIGEKEQTVMLSIQTHAEWTDCRLAWSEMEFNLVQSLSISPEKFRELQLFVPQTILLEEMNTLASQNSEVSVKISSSGSVNLHREYTSSISCTLDVTMYPFDSHSCNLTFESPFNSRDISLVYSNPSESIEAESRYLLSDGRFVKSDTWEVVFLPPIKSRRWWCSNSKLTGSGNMDDLKCCVDRLTYRLILRRHPHYQVVNLLVPAFLCLFLASCIFIIPPGATDKVFLMLTILLSLFLFLYLMYDKMPETGFTLPWISRYYLTCTMIVTLSCAVCCVTTTISACRITLSPKIIRWVLRFSFLLFGILPKEKNYCRQCEAKITGNKATEELLRCAPSILMHETIENNHQEVLKKQQDRHKFCEANITWLHVAACIERLYMIIVLSFSLGVLTVFLMYGYYSPDGPYGHHINTVDMPYVGAQLKLQGDTDLAHEQ